MTSENTPPTPPPETEYCSVNDIPLSEVPVPNYTEEEHGTWKILIEKQMSLLPGRACNEYLDGLKKVDFPMDRIPTLLEVSANIEKHTGWRIIRVDGLVHPKEFFDLLARNIFPSTDFIRKRSEVDYTPEPDMFHDLFGHTPLLTNTEFTEFFEAFGKVGVNALEKYPEDHPVNQMLPRLYWYNVEFGLIDEGNGPRAYGAGSVSSPNEIQFCVSDKCKKHPFDVDVIAQKDYDIWHLQEEVFVIPSWEKLGKDFRGWAKSHGLWD